MQKIALSSESLRTLVDNLAEAAAVLELEDPSMLAFMSAINNLAEDDLHLRQTLVYLKALELDLARSLEELKRNLAFLHSCHSAEEKLTLDRAALEREKRNIIVKAQEYQDELQRFPLRKNDDVSITSLLALEARTRAKEKDLKTLKIKLEAFHGLPPNLEAARQQLRLAREEQLKLVTIRDNLLGKMNTGLR